MAPRGFFKNFFFIDQIWREYGEPAWSSSLKYSASNYLLPVGGAMTMSEFCYFDVFSLDSCQACEIWGRFDHVQ